MGEIGESGAVQPAGESAATAETATPETPIPPLLVWTLSTANTVLFVLALVVPSYASGGLSDVLPNLSTALGVGIFLSLWVVVWATTRWLLGRVDPEEDSLARLALWGGVSGALDGIVFLLGIVLGLGLPTALVTSLQLLSIVLVAAIGTPIAAVVGAVVGLTGLVVDLAVLWAADHIRPRPRPDRR
jgi:hypothetical protein